MSKNSSKSAYELKRKKDPENKHTFSVIVDNEPGVLARVVGLFSGRGYNIESLTVSPVSADDKISRISIVTTGTEMTIEQIRKQLKRLIPVHTVHDLTTEGNSVEKEIALVKIKATDHQRRESLRIADVFKASVTDTTLESFVFQIQGSTDKIDAFINLMQDLGDIEVARSGVVALSRGPDVMVYD
jgi:acetolactate synthase-1/3 small subunit